MSNQNLTAAQSAVAPSEKPVLGTERLLEDLGQHGHLIINAALDAIVCINTEGRIILWNRQAERTFGWTQEEVIGRQMHEVLIPERYRQKHQNGVARYQLTGQGAPFNSRMETTVLSRSREELPVEINVVAIHDSEAEFYCAFIRDLRERVASEKKIRETEQKLTALVQNSTELIVITDKDGTYTYVSPSALTILGYTPDELIGANAFSFFHPDDAPQIRDSLEHLLRHGSVTVGPYRFRSKSGDWRWLESYAYNQLAHLAISGLVVNSHDVTERKVLQEALTRRYRRKQIDITAAVIHAQERERTQLSRELHDNVNQVLTTVKLYLELMRDGVGDMATLTARSIGQVQGCINELRSIAKRLSSPDQGSVSLVESVGELVGAINVTQKLQVTLQVNERQQPAVSACVSIAAYRIAQEALQNIIRYSEASEAFVQLLFGKETLQLVIGDNGKGFDLNQKRTGIGITNMKTRAENLEGSFQLESSPGKGTLLRVELPLSAPEPPVV